MILLYFNIPIININSTVFEPLAAYMYNFTSYYGASSHIVLQVNEFCYLSFKLMLKMYINFLIINFMICDFYFSYFCCKVNIFEYIIKNYKMLPKL